MEKVDPRLRLLCVFVLGMSVLFLKGYASLGFLSVVGGVMVVLRTRGRWLFVWSLLGSGFVFALHTVLTPGEIIWSFGFVSFTLQGVERGGMFGLRFFAMVSLTSGIAMSLSPEEAGLAVAWFLSKIPGIRGLSDSALIAMRFVGRMRKVYREILMAQQARGLLPVKKEIRALSKLPALVVPFSVQVLRDADALGIALEVRGYSHRGFPIDMGKVHGWWFALLVLLILCVCILLEAI